MCSTGRRDCDDARPTASISITTSSPTIIAAKPMPTAPSRPVFSPRWRRHDELFRLGRGDRTRATRLERIGPSTAAIHDQHPDRRRHSSAGPGAAPLRFAGIQYARNFAVQPGYITMPLPTVGGSAAVPSVADVYVDSALQGERQVTPGPFELRNFPCRRVAAPSVSSCCDCSGREIVSERPITPRPSCSGAACTTSHMSRVPARSIRTQKQPIWCILCVNFSPLRYQRPRNRLRRRRRRAKPPNCGAGAQRDPVRSGSGRRIGRRQPFARPIGYRGAASFPQLATGLVRRLSRLYQPALYRGRLSRRQAAAALHGPGLRRHAARARRVGINFLPPLAARRRR